MAVLPLWKRAERLARSSEAAGGRRAHVACPCEKRGRVSRVVEAQHSMKGSPEVQLGIVA